MRESTDMPRVLFVKKLLADGEPCPKCGDIERRLQKDGLMRYVGDIVPAVEGDPSSPGIRIAERHGVRRAPFFVLQHPDGGEQVIESYLAFKRWFSSAGPGGGEPDPAVEDLADAVDRHPDLAFI
jgi:hypothetical protein